MGNLLYFAYGSNMHTGRLQRRVPSASKFKDASLPGYSLVFHKQSVDGSAKCNIVCHQISIVHGVIFIIDEEDKPALDRAEGKGYKEKVIEVYPDKKPVKAFTYQALESYIDNSLSPYKWYKALVIEGAEQHGLPDRYLEKIKKVSSATDPDQKRRNNAFSILGIGNM